MRAEQNPMEQSTLQEILGVEKQIRAELDAERTEASRWLENARREIESAHCAELERIRHSGVQAEAAARQAAQDRAGSLARDADAMARAVASLSDEELRCRVRECIQAIVPEPARAR